jgi:ABC-type Fe3+ transport system substrate-binding protein
MTVGAAATAALLLTSGAWAQPTSEADLEKAALAEGQLTLYTSATDAESQVYIGGFQKRYPGIKVDWIRLSSGPQNTRFLAEHDAGTVNADLLHSGSSQIEQEHPELFEALTPDFIPNRANSKVATTNSSYVVVYAQPQGVGYNTDLVKPDDFKAHMQSWKDAADPYWKGKIALIDPFSNTSAMAWYKMMWETYGDDWIRGLVANNAGYAVSSQPAAQSVAAGANAVALPLTFLHVTSLRDKGAPVEVTLLEGPMTGIESTMGIPKGAKHPNAARLFVNWMLGPDAQSSACGFKSVMPVLDSATGDCVRFNANYRTLAAVLSSDEQKQLGALLGRQ